MTEPAPQPDESGKKPEDALGSDKGHTAGDQADIDALLTQATSLADEISDQVGSPPKQAGAEAGILPPPSQPPVQPTGDPPTSENKDKNNSDLDAIEAIVDEVPDSQASTDGRTDSPQDQQAEMLGDTADAQLDALDSLINGIEQDDGASPPIKRTSDAEADNTINAVEQTLASTHALTEQLVQAVGVEPVPPSAKVEVKPDEPITAPSEPSSDEPASPPPSPEPASDVDAALAAMEDLIGEIDGQNETLEVDSAATANGIQKKSKPASTSPDASVDEAGATAESTERVDPEPKDTPAEQPSLKSADQDENAGNAQPSASNATTEESPDGSVEKTDDDTLGKLKPLICDSNSEDSPDQVDDPQGSEAEVEIEAGDDQDIVADELAAMMARQDEKEDAAPPPAWKQVTRRAAALPIDAVETAFVYMDIPFAKLNPNLKTLIGYLGLGTLFMAITTWVLAIFIS